MKIEVISLFALISNINLAELSDVQAQGSLIQSFRSDLPGGGYQWGYNFPNQFHTESKDSQGNVDGVIGFVDAFGNPIKYKYRADPVIGFRVSDVEEDLVAQPQDQKNLPLAPEFSGLLSFRGQDLQARKDTHITDRIVPVPVLLRSSQTPENSVLFRVDDSNFPLKKSGNIENLPLHLFLPKGEVQSNGGVSSTAVKYGIKPVAAVHDAKVPRYS